MVRASTEEMKYPVRRTSLHFPTFKDDPPHNVGSSSSMVYLPDNTPLIYFDESPTDPLLGNVVFEMMPPTKKRVSNVCFPLPLKSSTIRQHSSGMKSPQGPRPKRPFLLKKNDVLPVQKGTCKLEPLYGNPFTRKQKYVKTGANAAWEISSSEEEDDNTAVEPEGSINDPLCLTPGDSVVRASSLLPKTIVRRVLHKDGGCSKKMDTLRAMNEILGQSRASVVRASKYTYSRDISAKRANLCVKTLMDPTSTHKTFPVRKISRRNSFQEKGVVKRTLKEHKRVNTSAFRKAKSYLTKNKKLMQIWANERSEKCTRNMYATDVLTLEGPRDKDTDEDTSSEASDSETSTDPYLPLFPPKPPPPSLLQPPPQSSHLMGVLGGTQTFVRYLGPICIPVAIIVYEIVCVYTWQEATVYNAAAAQEILLRRTYRLDAAVPPPHSAPGGDPQATNEHVTGDRGSGDTGGGEGPQSVAYVILPCVFGLFPISFVFFCVMKVRSDRAKQKLATRLATMPGSLATGVAAAHVRVPLSESIIFYQHYHRNQPYKVGAWNDDDPVPLEEDELGAASSGAASDTADDMADEAAFFFLHAEEGGLQNLWRGRH